MHKMEEFWENLKEKAKTGDPRKWNDLSKGEQDALIHAVNIMIMVLNNGVPKDAD